VTNGAPEQSPQSALTPATPGFAGLRASLDRRALAIAGATLILLTGLGMLGGLNEKFPGDLAVSTWVQSLESDWLDAVMEAIAAAGTSIGALAAVGIALLAVFALRGPRPAGYLFAVAAVGVIVRSVLKTAIARPRPTEDLVRVLDIRDSYSFPSGHVMFYVVLLGSLYFLLSSSGLSGRTIRLLQATIAIALALTGISRIYMGVHWMSDVLAGYVFGAALVVVAAWAWRRWTAA
jgi:membrane-associated phospholipid phosphatase